MGYMAAMFNYLLELAEGRLDIAQFSLLPFQLATLVIYKGIATLTIIQYLPARNLRRYYQG
jgi:hypothetical protein